MVRISSISCCSDNFRKCFHIGDKTKLRWFPGHMNTGLKRMQQHLKSVDCVIEVHDARIPLSGRNPNFEHTVSGLRPHILVLNKKDLSDLSRKDEVDRLLKAQGVNEVVYTNCKDPSCSGIKQLIPTTQRLIKSSMRYNRNEALDYTIMVIGVPNVGKSSLINVLRNKYLHKESAAPVGKIAGITRSVGKIKVSQSPLIYVLDTPGIMTPRVTNIESGMRLALCASQPDHLVGEDKIADYLLYWLNKNSLFGYVSFFGLKEPSDNISEVLALSAIRMNRFLKIKNFDGTYKLRPDLSYAARDFLNVFRTGKLGHYMLDLDYVIK